MTRLLHFVVLIFLCSCYCLAMIPTSFSTLTTIVNVRLSSVLIDTEIECNDYLATSMYANGYYPTTWNGYLTNALSVSFWYQHNNVSDHGNLIVMAFADIETQTDIFSFSMFNNVTDHGNLIVLAFADVETQNDIFSFYMLNGQPAYQHIHANDSVSFDTHGLITTQDLRDGIPHFILWTLSYSSGTISLYIDGMHEGETYDHRQ